MTSLPDRLPTLDAVSQGQLATVLELLRVVLGDRVLGVYLYGSAVQGGLRADSDLDVLAMLAGATSDADRRAILTGLMASSRSTERRDLRHREVTGVALADVVMTTTPGTSS